MDNTPFSDKVRLLTDLYMEYSGTDEWSDFFVMQDLGVPAAVLAWNGGATLTSVGEGFVNESWKALCRELSIDPDAEYKEIEDMVNEG